MSSQWFRVANQDVPAKYQVESGNAPAASDHEDVQGFRAFRDGDQWYVIVFATEEVLDFLRGRKETTVITRADAAAAMDAMRDAEWTEADIAHTYEK